MRLWLETIVQTRLHGFL